MRKRYFFSILCITILATISCQRNNLIIEPFYIANQNKIRDDGSKYITEEYTVKNWKDTKDKEMEIDSFVCQNIRADYKYIDSYFICFYHYSKEVNSDFYLKYKKICELEMAKNTILCYEFRKGRFTKSKGNSSNILKPLTMYNCNKYKT